MDSVSQKIVQKDNAVLRQIAAPVKAAEFGGVELQKLLGTMSQALAAEPDGIALAAPQLGVSQRIFIVSPKIPGRLIFINPRIIKLSKKKELMEEGCLSVRWLYGQVPRAVKASVEAYDENGKKFIHHGSGLMAQIFQHEIDHLNGVLFIDKAEDLQEVKPKDRETK